MKRLVGMLVVSIVAASCGSSPTAPSTPAAQNGAVIVISNFVVSAQGSPGAFVYHASFHLAETGGKAGATLNAFTFTETGNSGSAVVNTGLGKIAAGGSIDSATINITDAIAQSVASQMTVVVGFTDDTGKSGSATTSTSIKQVVLVTLSGTITDSASGAPVGGATVKVVGGSNVGVTATSDGAGHYALTPLVAGSFLIDVTASGYVSILSRSISIDRDTPFNIPLTKQAPAAPNVEYRITGSARRCSATYENSTGGTNQSEVNVPFSYSWSGARSGDFLYMSCQIDTGGDNGNITIGLYRNGILIQSASANGFPNIATVSGSY